MNFKRNIGLYLAIFSSCIAASIDISVKAGNPAGSLGAPVSNSQTKTDGNFASFTSLPLDVPQVAIELQNASLTIVHQPTGDKIDILSNCPQRWTATRSGVTQAATGSPSKGVSLTAGVGGGRIELFGKFYKLPADSDGVIRNLQVKDGVVTMNGKPLEPLPGSNVPGPCTGPDQLKVVVPAQYKGGLTLLLHGSSRADVDSWSGGEFKAVLVDDARLTAKKLVGLDKVVLDHRGKGSIAVNGLESKTFVVNAESASTIAIKDGKTEVSNATASGTGKIVLQGKYEKMSQSATPEARVDILP